MHVLHSVVPFRRRAIVADAKEVTHIRLQTTAANIFTLFIKLSKSDINCINPMYSIYLTYSGSNACLTKNISFCWVKRNLTLHIKTATESLETTNFIAYSIQEQAQFRTDSHTDGTDHFIQVM